MSFVTSEIKGRIIHNSSKNLANMMVNYLYIIFKVVDVFMKLYYINYNSRLRDVIASISLKLIRRLYSISA